MDGAHFFPHQPPPLIHPTKSRTSTVPATRGASIISRRRLRRRRCSSSSSSSSSRRSAGIVVRLGCVGRSVMCCSDWGVFLTNSTEKVYKSRHSGFSDNCFLCDLCHDECRTGRLCRAATTTIPSFWSHVTATRQAAAAGWTGRRLRRHHINVTLCHCVYNSKRGSRLAAPDCSRFRPEEGL